MKRGILFGAMMLTAGLLFSGEAAPVKIIVNRQNAVVSLTRKEISDLFLKKTAAWSSGLKVLPLDLKADSPTRQAFSKFIHGKEVNHIQAYWQQQVFSGNRLPPAEKGSEGDVINLVGTEGGAIGYVSPAATLPDTVKEITVKD